MERRDGGDDDGMGLSLIYGEASPRQHPLTFNPRPRNLCDSCGVIGTHYRCSKGCDYDACEQCWRRGVVSHISSDADQERVVPPAVNRAQRYRYPPIPLAPPTSPPSPPPPPPLLPEAGAAGTGPWHLLPSMHSLVPDSRLTHICDNCGVTGTHYRCSAGCDIDVCQKCWAAGTTAHLARFGGSDFLVGKPRGTNAASLLISNVSTVCPHNEAQAFTALQAFLAFGIPGVPVGFILDSATVTDIAELPGTVTPRQMWDIQAAYAHPDGKFLEKTLRLVFSRVESAFELA
eukprot:RCo013008